ncbi:MAG: hypothetical protein QF535_02285 [Anaerolineales bacterium]|nr:hypothetical protein [Anaerolineales bacterium]
MAYFLGRDVEVAITTEHNDLGVIVEEKGTTNELGAAVVEFTEGASANQYVNADKANLFAGPRAITSANGPWGDQNSTASSGLTCPDGTTTIVEAELWNNEPDNLTGLDLSMGVMDEDVAFIGQRNVLKAEVKKENSISITRKKKDSVWDAVFNTARFGIAKDAATATGTYFDAELFDGLRAPDFPECGYRVYLRFKESTAQGTGEVFILRNCYVTEHSVTVGADASSEETMTLQSYVDPIILDGKNPTLTAGNSLFVAPTLATEL